MIKFTPEAPNEPNLLKHIGPLYFGSLLAACIRFSKPLKSQDEARSVAASHLASMKPPSHSVTSQIRRSPGASLPLLRPFLQLAFFACL